MHNSESIPRSVMIVDDNARVRKMLREILQPTDMEILEFSSAEEAIEAYQRCRADVVLMDIRMEGMNGIDATREIRTLDPLAKVLIVSQYDDGDLRTAATSAGACGYILKDRLHDLRVLIDRFIRGT